MTVQGPLNATVTRSNAQDRNVKRMQTLIRLRSKDNPGFDETYFDNIDKRIRLVVLEDNEQVPPKAFEKLDAYEFLNRVFRAALRKGGEVRSFLIGQMQPDEIKIMQELNR